MFFAIHKPVLVTKTWEDIKREAVLFRLAYYDGRKERTARSLGISDRTLDRWLAIWAAEGWPITPGYRAVRRGTKAGVAMCGNMA